MTSFTILTVCTGNICRSPFAEDLLRQRLASAEPEIAVHSAGTHAVVGAPMQESSAAELVRRGGSADGFTARRLGPALIEGADLVLTMTRDQRAHALEQHPRALHRTFTLREFAFLLACLEAEREVAGTDAVGDGAALADIVAAAAARRSRLAGLPGAELDIADPYGLDTGAYRIMADEIADAVDAVVASLVRLRSPAGVE